MTTSSSNEDTNITDNSTTAQQDSGQTSVAAGQGYTDNSKTKARKQQEQQRQRQENEQPANQE